MKKPRPAKSYSVPAIHRTLDILETLASENDGMTITEVSRRFRIPKSSAYAILQTLKSRDYLEKDGEDRYRLTLKVFCLANTLVGSLDLRRQAYPLLKDLAEKSRISGHIAVLDHGSAVYIEKVEVLGAIRLTTWIGKRMPLHSTSIGKALLAYLPQGDIERIFKRHGFIRFTPRTIASLAELNKELARVRNAGFAVANEENEEGVRAVAAPIFNHSGQAVAAVNLGGSTLQIRIRDLPRLGEMVRSCAQQISKRLGYGQRKQGAG